VLGIDFSQKSINPRYVARQERAADLARPLSGRRAWSHAADWQRRALSSDVLRGRAWASRKRGSTYPPSEDPALA
jgi:hypothetical protein